MKRTIVSVGLLLVVSLVSYAQLRVNNLGSILMADSVYYGAKDLVSVNKSRNYSFYNLSNFTSTLQDDPYFYGYRVAILGDAYAYGSSHIYNVGVIGKTGCNSGGYNNFGVWGRIDSSKGAAIFGSCDNLTTPSITGNYAGYFNGATYVNGVLTAASYVTLSDKELKRNISSICQEPTLDNLLKMNIVKYNYKEKEADTTLIFSEEKNIKSAIDEDLIHFGLLAQELREIYPNLVVKGQDGHLGVNYMELVPLLIRSVQELKTELDAVKSTIDVDRKTPSRIVAADYESGKFAMLYQNRPNPFSAQTEIRFSLPEDTKNAFIHIFDMTGKTLKQIPVDNSMQSVTINGYELSAGMYLYALTINGQEIDTKRMILS